MQAIALALIIFAIVLPLYAYVGYPALLALLSLVRRRPLPQPEADTAYPRISITVPVYNEEKQIRPLLERLLDLDYPADRREILIVSDASSDGTDDIVREFASSGVKLLRMQERMGKTAAENVARNQLTGDIVVNTDASIRIERGALKPLIACFADPAIGLASGRDLSVTAHGESANAGESRYVGYEMWVRGLETRIESIVGASGCFYAIRAPLHRQPLPDWLSRDFASALITREHGYRAVSVDAARCYVPRTNSLQKEYRRKVRTITRGMGTLLHKRHLLNPLRHPLFAVMLFSHKICRWLVPWALVGGMIGLAMLSSTSSIAAALLVLGTAGVLTGVAAWWLADRVSLPRLLALPAAVISANVAALHASVRAAQGQRNPIWEPTRRDTVTVS